MTDTARRKDLIYPKNDSLELKNGDQFESKSTNSPLHTSGQSNGVVPSTTKPIQIALDNGFSSEDDSDGEELMTISQSGGPGEVGKTKGESTMSFLSPMFTELPNNQDLIVDGRIESSYRTFTKPTSKSLPRKCVSSVDQRASKSYQSSPTHSSSLQISTLGNLRSASPEIGRRIKSSPFFVQDRLSQSNLGSSDRQRLDSAPSKVNLRVGNSSQEELGTNQSANGEMWLSSSWSFSGNMGSPVKKSAEPRVTVDIQSRIKLWAEKEREAKESKEQELDRVRSPPSQKSSPTREGMSPEKSQQSSQIKKLIKVLKNVDLTEQEGSNKTAKQKKVTKKQDSHGSSSSLGSPSRSRKDIQRSRSGSKGSKDSSSDQTPETSPKKSRWKIKSPLFGRKKMATSESLDSEQSDDNLLMGSEEHLATGKKGACESSSPRSGRKKGGEGSPISKRSSNKRKAVKKRLSGAIAQLPVFRSRSDSRTLDDQAIPSQHSALRVRQRSNSEGPKLRMRTAHHRRAASHPDIKSLVIHSPASEVALISDLGNSKAATVAEENENKSPNLSVTIREVKGRRTEAAEDRTISRDIRDIINSLGTGSLELDENMTKVVEECVCAEVNGITEQAPPTDAPLNIVIEPPSNDNKLSSIFSENEETFIPRGGSLQEVGPIMSSLDHGNARRVAIKRRLSDINKPPHGTKTTAHPKAHPLPRVGSLSPTTDDSSDTVIATSLMYADAVWDRVALEEDELSFSVGDAIEILDMTDDVWWYGSVDSANGWFPASFVRLRIGQDSDEDNDSVISADSVSSPTLSYDTPPPPQPTTEPPRLQLSEKLPEDDVGELQPLEKRRPSRHQSGSVHRRMTIRRKDSAPSQPRKLTSTEVRAKVIEEILSTERDYVRHLEDIIEGYVKQCRKYNKLFDEEKVETIFSNVEAIYSFQKDFLRELEASINRDKIEDTQIGEVFMNNRHEFDIYCQYCNNHPHAVNEMNQLQENEQYTFFFESCRLLRNLQDISLEGFLLTPVQKICKYPLQLTELLKYTSEDHPDHSHVVAARDAMREVAMHINEMKRRMENIGKIGRWQASIEGWKGDDILETSSQMLRCGELHKISKGRSQERHFFLFDNQLIYCKKDAIGGKLTYKGRVYLDQCQVTDMEDGTAIHSGSVVKYAWRMNNKAKDNKWYIIFAKSPEEKRDWMDAFKKERELTKDEEEKKFRVSLKMKKSAVALCVSAEQLRRGRRKSSSVPSKNRAAVTESVDSATKHKLVSQRLSVSNPQPKSKTIGRKKRGSNG